MTGLLEFFSKLLDTSDYPPRWNCGSWTSGEGWLHIVSDIATWGAYTSIPIALVLFVRRRDDFYFKRIYLLFAAFILACGMVHLLEAIIFWQPVYRLAGVMKLITAVASWATVIALIRVAPVALELPGLKSANERLQSEVARRIAAEKLLTASEERFRRTFENAAVGIAHVSPEGTWLRVNARLCEIVGYTPKEMTQLTFQKITHPDDLAADLAQVEQLLAGDIDSYSLEKRYVRKGGTPVWVQLTVSLVRDAEGQAEYFIAAVQDISDRKQVEQASQEHQRRLQAFLDNAPSCMGVVEVPADNSDVLHVIDNATTERFFGVGPGATAGKWSHGELNANAETVQHWIAQYREAQRLQTSVKFLDRFVAPDSPNSEVSVLNVVVSYLGPGDAGRDRFCYVSVDDTDRTRAETALRQNQERQLLLLGFMQANRDQNDEERLLAAAAEALGRHLKAHRVGFLEIENRDTMKFGPCWTDGTLPVLSGTMPIDAIGSRYAAEIRAGRTVGIADAEIDPLTADSEFSDLGTRAGIGVPIMRDGRWVAGLYVNHAMPRQWKEDEIDFVQKAADQTWDAVERTRAVRALADSENSLRLATELGRMGVLLIDYADDSIVLDETAARLFDLPAGERVARERVWQRFHPDDADQIVGQIERLVDIGGEGTLALEHRVVHSDGTVRWLDVRKQIYFATASQGRPQPRRGIVAAIDITERKQHEEKLEEARRQAEAANRARGEFLANMSHEIRTPMAAIIGHTEILLSHLKNPDNRQCALTIQRNGNHLLEIINDILDLSRIEAGKMHIERAPCDVAKLLYDIESLMHIRVDPQKVAFRVVASTLIPETIETDAKRLKQVLLNLVGNAVKFTRQGHVELRAVLDTPRRQIRFEVEDTGIGMSPAILDKLFEPFSQGDASRTRQYGGSGLGLAISKRLMEILGGDISATSTDGQGSTFTVTLPLPHAQDLRLVSFGRVDAGEDEWSPAALRPIEGRILLVDDRRDIRFVGQHFLEEAGAEVDTAQDGEEAIKMVEAARQQGRQYAAILMDIQMPKMDGNAATAQLRASGYDMPIIALTADAMREDRDRCFQSGCDDYLAKPIEGARLVEMVGHLTQDITRDELRAVRRSRGVAEGNASPDAS